MHKFSYLFLRNASIPINFLEMTSYIAATSRDEEVRKKEYPDIFTKLRQIAILQSVTASNAIEGIVSSDKRISEIVNNNSAPLNHDEQEISGYKDALNFIHTNHETIPVNETTILQLHSLLYSHSNFASAGHYKPKDNCIEELYADGHYAVRWVPVSYEKTGAAMEQLLLAYSVASNRADINQLLLIPCFILDFLCIHPFQDGNGRMSRLLTILLLYKIGFDIPAYISFEEQINKEKELYYQALKDSSQKWHESRNSYIPFINNFLQTLFMCYKELTKRFATLHDGTVKKFERIREVVLNSILPISKKEICDILLDVSPATVSAVLSTMLKEGSIIKTGSTRGARYSRKYSGTWGHT